MYQYAVFLRGISVGGNATVSMGTLKTLLSDAGYSNVETYLNSGNVILETERGVGEAALHLEQLIERKFGLKISIFILTREDLANIVANNPFDAVTEADNSKRMVALFREATTPGPGLVILRDGQEDADYYLYGNLIYIYYKVGAGRARITNPFIRQLFKQVSTSRNWNTITKILEKIKG